MYAYHRISIYDKLIGKIISLFFFSPSYFRANEIFLKSKVRRCNYTAERESRSRRKTEQNRTKFRTGIVARSISGCARTIVRARFQKVNQINFNCRPRPGSSPSNRTLAENAYVLASWPNINWRGKQLAGKL